MAPRRQQHSGQFFDVFKRCGVDGWPRGDFERAGDASVAVDRAIGRPVVRLVGAVPAANSLRLPRQREASLGSTHRFLYLQLRLDPGKSYAVHADYTTADRAQHRLTISNLHGGDRQAAARARRAGGLQIFLPAVHDAWTLLAVDLQGVAAAAAGGASAAGGGSPFARLRAITLCANMTVRSAFTSDVIYDWLSLPADLAFSAAYDVAQARLLWLPGQPQAAAQVAAPRPRPTSPRPGVPRRASAAPTRDREAPQPVQGSAAAHDGEQLVMQPAPIAQLEHVASFSGRRPGLLLWVPGSNGDSPQLVFAAGSLIVAMPPLAPASSREQGQQAQRHLRGHVAAVCALAPSADGGRLTSAEEGAGAALRLWDLRQGLCIATVPGHSGGTTCLDLSPDGSLLASAGLDSQGRQELACWDVSACWGSAGGSSAAGKAVELARQASDYSIQALKFLPHDPARLVTCGKNSIRVHRLKGGQLRSLSVPMDGVVASRRPYSCGTLVSPASTTVGEVFTCMAFEQPLRERPSGARCLFVGTGSGALYTVNLEARMVEAVDQLHSAALAALAVHDGFCVTGSADCRLRVWGSDLQEAYMEAAHEGSVTGIGLSPDGLWVAVGTDSGALSLLDISSSKYNTLLRSHTAPVHAVALLAPEQQACQAQQQQEVQYCTAGADGTVRVWSGVSHQQVLELHAPGETVLSIACHPSKAEVACGFQSGALRIFDASTAVLVQESRQHTGAVTQLAFARHGRELLSLGEDGCVCAYDVQRSYMPTTFVLAGFPLHGTAMAVSADGKVLAVAALSMRPSSPDSCRVGRPSSPSAQRGRSSGTGAQPVIVLHSTLGMQPTLQLPVPGSSCVVQLQLLPDSRHILALTEDGRLLGFSSSDGLQVLDVPRSMPQPCVASALDPSGTFLVAGTAGGQLKVWGLHPLHRLALGPHSFSPGQVQGEAAPTNSIIRSLPCQELGAAAGSAVLGAAFLGSRQLLTAGSAGEVCCWAFHGEPCNSCAASTAPADVATAGALVVVKQSQTHAEPGARPCQQPLQQLQPAAGIKATLRPTITLAADCTSSRPAQDAALLPSCQPAAPAPDGEQKGQEQQEPGTGPQLQEAACSDSPAPRPLPAALRQLPTRPPSAPAVPRQQDVAVSCRLPHGPQQSASLPATPLRASSKVPPIWERQPQPPEASLLITATPGKRYAQVVRQGKELQVSLATKSCVSGGTGAQLRSAKWVESEVAGDRVPAYRPDHQLQLLPPTATVRRVHGFSAAAGFHWLPACAQHAEQSLLYAGSNVLLLEDLASAQQRHVARLPREVTALAATADGRLAAAAVAPAVAEGSTADIHLVGLQGGPAAGLTVLSHHSFAVQAMAFSPDGSLLATLSCAPDSSSSSLALWSVEEPAELVAAVELAEAPAGLAWEAQAAPGLPTFYTAGKQGLVQWQLEPEALSSSAVHMPAALRGVALTAVAACATQGEELKEGSSAAGRPGMSTVYVGDGSGRVWQLEVDCGQDVRRSQVLAEVQGQAVSCLRAAGPHLLAVGTSTGTVLLLAGEGWSDREATWRLLCGEQLDGAITGLQLDACNMHVTAGTACGTLWQVAPTSLHAPAARVLLCGQQDGLRSWQLAPGAAWKGVPPTAAVASAGGVAVWQLGEAAGSNARAPLVEFSLPPDAMHIGLADDASVCAAAYGDNSICLFDVAAARLRWQAAAAAEQGGIAALAVVQRLRGCKVMIAYRSGALLVLDGSSGQVAHRTLQFAVQQDSGRLCPANFRLAGLAMHPADSALFALCGQQELQVCKATWVKNAAVAPLARLSFAPAGCASRAHAEHSDEAPAPLAVQAVFSRAHPGHLYCSNPAAPGQLLLFDYSTQAVIKTLLAPLVDGAQITSLALRPAETLLAAGTSAGSVLLLRLETESWAELAAHGEGAPVVGLAFTACGRRLFSAAAGASAATFEWELGS